LNKIDSNHNSECTNTDKKGIVILDHPHCLLMCPRHRTTGKYPGKPYVSRNHSPWVTFLLPIVWVYLYSSFCGQLF